MPATDSAEGRATNATLRMDVFDAAAEALGATTNVAKARLVGLNTATIWRYRRGDLAPSLATAAQIASRLGVKVDDLVPAAAA